METGKVIKIICTAKILKIFNQGLCDAALVGGSQLILTNGLSEYTK